MKIQNLLQNVPHRKISVKIDKDGSKIVKGERNNYTIEQIEQDRGYGNCYSYYLKYSDITCIDVDEDLQPEFLKGVPYTKSLSNKGYHYYIKTDMPQYKNEIQVFNDFNGDLINDKRNVWEKKNNTVYGGTEIPFIPFETLKTYLNITKLNIIDKEKPTEGKVFDKNTFEKLKNMLEFISSEHSDSYDTWSQIAYAIYNISHECGSIRKGINLIHTFSEQSDNYDEEKVNKFIDGMKYTPHGYNMGTIVNYAKNNPDYELTITKQYKDVKLQFEKNHFKIMHPICYCKEENGEVYIINKTSFKDMYENLHHTEKTKDGSTVLKNFVGTWMRDKNIRTYKKLDFCPDGCPDDVYNTFTGFNSKITDNPINIEPMLNHIKILVGNDDVSYEYFVDWLASIVQTPGNIQGQGIAILFKSDQGVGKGLFMNWFGRKVLGDKYYYSTSKIDNILGKYAIGVKNKLLVNLDEASGKDTFQNNDDIKNLITEPKLTFEQKYCNAFEINNFARLIFTSNNQTPIKIERTDRRFVCYESSSDKIIKKDRKGVILDTPENKENVDYFKKLVSFVENPLSHDSFYTFLMNRDITKRDWQNRPTTELYNDIRSQNTPPLALFLADEHTRKNNNILSSLLFSQYKNYASSMGFKVESINITQFGRMMNKYKGITKKRSSKGNVYFINANELKQYLIDMQYIDEETDDEIYKFVDDEYSD